MLVLPYEIGHVLGYALLCKLYHHMLHDMQQTMHTTILVPVTGINLPPPTIAPAAVKMPDKHRIQKGTG